MTRRQLKIIPHVPIPPDGTGTVTNAIPLLPIFGAHRPQYRDSRPPSNRRAYQARHRTSRASWLRKSMAWRLSPVLRKGKEAVREVTRVSRPSHPSRPSGSQPPLSLSTSRTVHPWGKSRERRGHKVQVVRRRRPPPSSPVKVNLPSRRAGAKSVVRPPTANIGPSEAPPPARDFRARLLDRLSAENSLATEARLRSQARLRTRLAAERRLAKKNHDDDDGITA